MEDLLPFELPTNMSSIIKVLGVGGGGSNAVNHMFKQGINGVDFIIANTDAQALGKSPVPIKIQLGATLTEGLGAGNRPERGREAAIESIEEIVRELGDNTKMVFITAGMGGGTGTGAAPVIAKATKDLGILTVGIVTLPFKYEGQKRVSQAALGIQEMSKHVDSLLIVNNEKLREIYGDLKASEAFGKADDVLTVAAKGIAEIITIEGHINVDFADVKTVMSDSGIALMGSGKAQGENRAELAVKEALSSPLLDNNDIVGAKNILLNITSGRQEATMDEIGLINEFVQREAGNNADLIWGSSIDDSLDDHIAVTVIATGFGADDIPELYSNLMGTQAIKNEAEQVIEKEKAQQAPTRVTIAAEVPEKENNDIILTDDEDIELEIDGKLFENAGEDEIIIVKGNKPISDNEKRKMFYSNEIQKETSVMERNPEVEDKGPVSYGSFEPSEYANRVEEFENIPAYKRAGMKIDVETEKKKEMMSKYTLSGNGNDVFLSEKNQYLHDKAD